MAEALKHCWSRSTRGWLFYHNEGPSIIHRLRQAGEAVTRHHRHFYGNRESGMDSLWHAESKEAGNLYNLTQRKNDSICRLKSRVTPMQLLQ